MAPQHIPFEPLGDQLLVIWEDQPEKQGLIIVPGVARRPGADGSDKFLRFGRVVKTGPGDKVVTAYCACGRGTTLRDKTVRVCDAKDSTHVVFGRCASCQRHGPWQTVALRNEPCIARPGDRILYDHPSDREYVIGGQRYVIIHEEQHVLALIDDEPVSQQGAGN